MSCQAHALAATRRFLQAEDVDLIRELVAMLPNMPRVIDLGAGSGTTALAVYAERPYAAVFTIDIDKANIDWAEANIGELSMGSWHGTCMDSVEAAELFVADTLLDMLLIDTSHEYEHTVRELNAWLSLLAPKTPVWLHDYVGNYPGVTQAVDEFVVAGKLIPYKVQGLGWGGFKA